MHAVDWAIVVSYFVMLGVIAVWVIRQRVTTGRHEGLEAVDDWVETRR